MARVAQERLKFLTGTTVMRLGELDGWTTELNIVFVPNTS